MQSQKITFEIKNNVINISKKTSNLIEDENTIFFFIGEINNIDKLLENHKIINLSKKGHKFCEITFKNNASIWQLSSQYKHWKLFSFPCRTISN